MYLPLLEEAIGQESWPRSVVTHLDLETPGPSLAKMEGNIAVIARVSDINSKSFSSGSSSVSQGV